MYLMGDAATLHTHFTARDSVRSFTRTKRVRNTRAREIALTLCVVLVAP